MSAASLWEIAIKRALGTLSAPDDVPAHIEAGGFGWLPVTAARAWEARSLLLHHRDPFDRLLAALSMLERVPIITADPHLRRYVVDTVW